MSLFLILIPYLKQSLLVSGIATPEALSNYEEKMERQGNFILGNNFFFLWIYIPK